MADTIQQVLPLTEDKIARNFAQFHRQNPHVYEGLRRLALKIRQAGHHHYGIKALFEVLRYEFALTTVSADGLKLNNNYTALYARLLMEKEPELDGFFYLRERIARYRPDQIS
jgi:hypothetical protein